MSLTGLQVARAKSKEEEQPFQPVMLEELESINKNKEINFNTVLTLYRAINSKWITD